MGCVDKRQYRTGFNELYHLCTATYCVNILRMAKKGTMTDRQLAFCNHYQKNGERGDLAAVAAGYSTKAAKQIACNLLKQTHIINYLDRRKETIVKKLDITIEKKMNVLWDIASQTLAKDSDRINAINVLNKMQGHDAPIKVENKFDSPISAVIMLPENGRTVIVNQGA